MRAAARVVAVLLIAAASSLAQHPWRPTAFQSGKVQCLAADSSGVLFAGIGGGLIVSSDQGTTWDTLQLTLFSDPFSLLVTPDSQKLFIAVENGVYRSSDGGRTWLMLPEELVGVYSLGQRGRGELFASGSRGVYRTTDDGNTWAHVWNEPGTFNDGIVISPSGSVFSASIVGGLYRSSDGGGTWEKMNPVDGSVTAMVAHAQSGSILVASALPHPTRGQWPFLLYRSTDDGASWSAPDTMAGLVDLLYADGGGGIIASDDSLRRSTDGGLSWSSIADSLPSGFAVRALAEIEGTLYAGDDSFGVWKNSSLLAGATGVKPPQAGLPWKFALRQNYPNPFNPATNVSVAVPVTSHVRLEVFDMLGRHVAILADAEKNPGEYVFPFTAGGLPSGVYIVRLEARDAATAEFRFSASARMMLLK